jgi:hypothetical protein
VIAGVGSNDEDTRAEAGTPPSNDNSGIFNVSGKDEDATAGVGSNNEDTRAEADAPSSDNDGEIFDTSDDDHDAVAGIGSNDDDDDGAKADTLSPDDDGEIFNSSDDDNDALAGIASNNNNNRAKADALLSGNDGEIRNASSDNDDYDDGQCYQMMEDRPMLDEESAIFVPAPDTSGASQDGVGGSSSAPTFGYHEQVDFQQGLVEAVAACLLSR